MSSSVCMCLFIVLIDFVNMKRTIVVNNVRIWDFEPNGLEKNDLFVIMFHLKK